jgi:hypothetical protein
MDTGSFNAFALLLFAMLMAIMLLHFALTTRQLNHMEKRLKLIMTKLGIDESEVK